MQPEIPLEHTENVNRILKAITLCGVLGISENLLKEADWDKQLNKVYRRLCLKVHPDKNHAPRAVEAFHIVEDSYQELIATGKNRYLKADNAPPKPTVKPASNPDAFMADLFRRTRAKQEQKEREEAQEYFFRSWKPYEYQRPEPPRPQPRREWFDTCQATTKAGKQCGKQAVDGRYCAIHLDYDPNARPAPEKQSKVVQCRAKTKAGVQCTKIIDRGLTYCNIHNDYDPNEPPPAEKPAKVKCNANTKTGNPCQSYAMKGSPYCKSHQ